MLNTDARATARPATFDGSDQARRAMLAKVHIAKKALALDEDDYRQLMRDEAKVSSAKDATRQGLERVLERFRALGWQDTPKRGGARRATSPMAKKARAMWISLYQLGVVHHRGEKALETFAKRQLGCERMAWANQREADKLIEALKAMATRAGWKQVDGNGKPLSVRQLTEGLCLAIVAKLKDAGEIPENWTLSDAAFQLCGVELGLDGPTSAEGYTELAEQLGAKLRAAGGAA